MTDDDYPIHYRGNANVQPNFNSKYSGIYMPSRTKVITASTYDKSNMMMYNTGSNFSSTHGY